MIAYLLAPVLAFISCIFFFLPSEVAILALANVGKANIVVFGKSVNLAPYGTDFPWLLPFAAAAGSVFGSYVYYLMGSGAMKMSDKLKTKIESFNFEKTGKTREIVVLTSNIISVPPVSVVSVASGIIRFNVPRFFAMSFIGKVIRYYIVIIAGQFAIDSLLKLF